MVSYNGHFISIETFQLMLPLVAMATERSIGPNRLQAK